MVSSKTGRRRDPEEFPGKEGRPTLSSAHLLDGPRNSPCQHSALSAVQVAPVRRDGKWLNFTVYVPPGGLLIVFGGVFPLYLDVVNLDRGIPCSDCDPTIKLHLMRIEMHSVRIAQAWRRAEDPDQRQCDCR